MADDNSTRFFLLLRGVWGGVFSFALVCLLAACSLSRTELSPKEELPPPAPAVQVQEAARREVRPIEENGSLTVDRAIREALRASPELDQIRSRVTASGEQIKQAEAAFYPRIVLSESFNTTDNPVYALMYIINQRRFQTTINFNDPGQQQNISSVVQGEWPVYEGGSSWYERNAAVNQRHSVQSELLAARNHLVGKVTETYYQWLQALVFINVAERMLEAARLDERLGEARFHAEMALPSELLRLKAHTAEVQGNLVSARSSARRFQAALERLMVRAVHSEEIPNPSLSEGLLNAEELLPAPETLVKQALNKRPEMASVRSLIQAASDRVKSSQGRLAPKIVVGANYEWDSESFTRSAGSWMMDVQAVWPIFEGGITWSKIGEARARLKEIEARGEQVALDVALEVNQSLLAVEEASEKIKVAGERKKWAEKALEEVRFAYGKQVVTVDSLLQSEVAWNQAEVAFASAVFELRIAQALLRKSLGDFAEWLK